MYGTPFSNSFSYITGNDLTTRPVATIGTSITPGNNTYGSYTSILAGGSILYDCYLISVTIHSLAVAAAAKDAICTIGMDPTGGTTYVDLIPDLLCSCATAYGTGGLGHRYTFPLFIPAGAQLAAKMSVNNATVGTGRVFVQLYGQPSRPDALEVGTSVEAVGIVAASSRGTTVTPGTASEGAWTSLGTSVRDCFAWQLGVGQNDTTMAAVFYHNDLSHGDATNKHLIIENSLSISTASEAISHENRAGTGIRQIPAGSTLYGRSQCSGTADASFSMAAYGVRH